MYAGVWIASKPFVPFFITPNGDMARVDIISNGGFWLLVCADMYSGSIFII